jgi:glycosyltransferase involved in cell wall biosynthesis
MAMSRGTDRRGKTDICFVSLGWSVAKIAAGRNSESTGGAELQVGRLTQFMAEADYRVALLASFSANAPGIAEELRERGVYLVATYREGRIPVLRYFYATIPRFWSALKEADSGLYYVRGSTGLVGVAAEFCRRYGRRLVFAVSSDQDVDPELIHRRFHRSDRALYQWGLRKADAVVVQTHVQREMLRRHWGIEGILIRSLYLRPPAPPSDAPREYVLWAGRTRRIKRPELFLELARRMPHLQFAMAGQREMHGEEDLYRTVLEEAATVPNLRDLGALPFAEMADWYDRSWAFVNTSATEGFPNTFLEAWDHGLPVIATVDPDHLVSEGGLGYYCETVEQIADRLEMLRRNPALREEIGARARSYVAAEHQKERIVAQYTELISSLLSGRARAHEAVRP